MDQNLAKSRDKNLDYECDTKEASCHINYVIKYCCKNTSK